MGQYAAKSILNNFYGVENYLDYSFANFAHSTRTGYKTYSTVEAIILN